MPGPVFPSEAPRPAKSQAEKAVWSCLKKQLPNGWTAWHSLKLKDRNAYLGETDFVLAHPDRGVLVLEVKGGVIEQRDGRWFSSGTPLERAPLDQARDYLKKLLHRLADEGCQPPAWGAAAAFPDVEFDNPPGQDDLAGVVLGRNHLTWFAESFPSVVERALPAPGGATGKWMNRLHDLWSESWIPRLSLGTRVELGRERRLELDDLQLFALDFLGAQERALVQGGAGSGKTLLAVEAARRQAAAGKKVLLLCFTQPLRRWLEARAGGGGIEVATVSGLAKQLAEEVDGPWHAQDLTETEVWRRYYERASDVCTPRWDAVIVDEAQDLMFEAWYFVKALSEGKRLWAFHDPGQGFWPDRSPPADLFPPAYPLHRGQRSPPGVEALARRYLGQAGDGDAIRRAVRDGALAFVPCPDPARTAEVVGAELDRLRGQGVAFEDIGVVSLRGQTRKDAVHHAASLGQHAFVGADAPDMEERLVADSFLRWKGLERPIVVIADVDPAASRFGTRMHIALTRALTGARIVAPPPGDGRSWPGLDER